MSNINIYFNTELNEETGNTVIDQLLDAKVQNEEIIELNDRLRYEEDYTPLYCDQITFYISSPGGDLYKLIEIFDLIDQLKEQGVLFVGKVSAIAYSASFYLLMKMDVVEVSEWSNLMYHNMLASYDYININDLKDDLTRKMKLQEKLDKIVLDNTTIPKELLEEHKQKDLYFDYDDAIKYNIIKKYEEPKPQMTLEEFDTYVESLKDAIEIIDDIEYDEVKDE